MMITLRELAARTESQFIGDGDSVLTAAKSLEEAGKQDITFVYHAKQWLNAYKSDAGVIVCSTYHAAHKTDLLRSAVLYGDNSALIWAKSLKILYPKEEQRSIDISETAQLDPTVHTERNVSIGDFSFLGAGVSIGENTRIDAHVCIYAGVQIGANVHIKSGTILGAAGFGYAPDGDQNISVPQIGNLFIDANVVIAANCTIDKGRLRDTKIGKGTKIDSQVHIGHGVQIGENVIIIAQCGVAGDVTIGDNVIIGGQSAIAPYVTIAKGARISSKSGVHTDVSENAVVSGIPAIPHRRWLKSSLYFYQLNSLFKRVKRLEK